MGLDPAKIAITKHAFSKDESGIANYAPSLIRVVNDMETTTIEKLAARQTAQFIPAEGWRGHCES